MCVVITLPVEVSDQPEKEYPTRIGFVAGLLARPSAPIETVAVSVAFPLANVPPFGLNVTVVVPFATTISRIFSCVAPTESVTLAVKV